MIVRRHTDNSVGGFLQREDCEDLTQRTFDTDHIIRTKRLPMIGANKSSLDQYVEEYKSYVEEFRHRSEPS